MQHCGCKFILPLGVCWLSVMKEKLILCCEKEGMPHTTFWLPLRVLNETRAMLLDGAFFRYQESDMKSSKSDAQKPGWVRSGSGRAGPSALSGSGDLWLTAPCKNNHTPWAFSTFIYFHVYVTHSSVLFEFRLGMNAALYRTVTWRNKHGYCFFL